MACYVLRIDNEDLNSSNGFNSMGAAVPILDTTVHRIYFCYTCCSATEGQSGGENHSKAVYFRALDYESETFDSLPVKVAGSSTDVVISSQAAVDRVAMVRDANTGRFYVFYGDAPGVAMRYSDDLGQTWTLPEIAVAQILFRGLLAVTINAAGDIFLWVEQLAGGTDENDTWLYKRPFITGAWGLVGLFDDGSRSPNSGIQPEGGNQTESALFKEDNLTSLIVFGRLEAGGVTSSLRCYYTTTNWSSWNSVAIKNYNPNITLEGPIVRRGVVNTNRIWVLWVELTPLVPWLAYSDDWGASWTVVGTPPAFAGYGWDENWDRGFFIDWADNLYSSVFDTNGPNTSHIAWTSSDGTNLNSWTHDDCDVADNLTVNTTWFESGETKGHCFYVTKADGSTRFIRDFNRGWPLKFAGGSGFNLKTYDVLFKTNFVPPPPTPPPPPGPEDTTTRMFRRGVIQAQKPPFDNAGRAPGTYDTWKHIPGWGY